MSPDSTPSTASDVFSLGVTLFSLLCGDGSGRALPQHAESTPLAQFGHLPLDREALRAGLLQAATAEAGAPLASQGMEGLLAAMVQEQSGERPAAAEVAAALEVLVAALDVRECVVCGEAHPLAAGLQCAGDGRGGEQEREEGRHFICRDCFCGDVQHRQLELLTIDNFGVRCCALECASVPFTAQEVAMHVTPTVDDAYRQRLLEIQLEQQEIAFAHRQKQAEERMLQRKGHGGWWWAPGIGLAGIDICV